MRHWVWLWCLLWFASPAFAQQMGPLAVGGQSSFQDPVTNCEEIRPLSGLDGVATLPARMSNLAPLDSSGWLTYSVCAAACDYTTIQLAYDQAVLDGATQNVRIQVDVGYAAGRLVMTDRGASTFWIYVEPDTFAGFPTYGSRVNWADFDKMYILEGELGGTTWTEPLWAQFGAGYTRFIGAEFRVAEDNTIRARSNLVRIRADEGGSDPTNADDVPDWVILDRVWVHADPGHRNTLNAIGISGSNIAVLYSYIYNGGPGGFGESHAIGSDYAIGPIHIEGNYIGGTSMGVMMGTGTTPPNGWQPSDITIRRNHIHRPVWWAEDPSGHSSIKNWYESKAASRVLIECNLFEYNWSDAQTGKAMLLRSETDQTEDITIRYNRFYDTQDGFDFNATDTSDIAADGLRRVRMHNNVVIKHGSESLFNDGLTHHGLLLTSDGSPASDELTDVEIQHNTFGYSDIGSGMAIAVAPANNIDGQNNIIDKQAFGFGKASGFTEGDASWDGGFGAGNWTQDFNVIVDANCSLYGPRSNDCPTQATMTASEFEDYANDDLRLVAGSQYRTGGANPPDTGRMRGADVESIDNVISGLVQDMGAGPKGVYLDWNAPGETNCLTSEWESGQIGLVNGPESTSGALNCDQNETNLTPLPPTPFWAWTDELIRVNNNGIEGEICWEFVSGTVNDYWFVIRWAGDDTGQTTINDIFRLKTGGVYNGVSVGFSQSIQQQLWLTTEDGTQANTGTGSMLPDTYYQTIVHYNAPDDLMRVWHAGKTTLLAPDGVADGAVAGTAFDQVCLVDSLGDSLPNWFVQLCASADDPRDGSGCLAAP